MKKLPALAFLALLAGGSPPARAGLPTILPVLGNAIRAHYLNNEIIGRSGYKVLFRGQAPAAACYSTLQVYHMAAGGGTGYSAGTGGTVRVHLETLNASDLPSGTAIGGSATWAPALVGGGLPSGQNSHYLFHTYTLASAACLSAGQKFGLVFDNVDPNPSANWISVNTITASGSAQFPALDPVWAVYMLQNGTWVRREPPYSSDVPTMALCPASGACLSQTYMQNGGDRTVGGAAAARQFLTPPTGGTVRACHIDATRSSTSVTRVRVGLTSTAGAYLNGGSAFVDADATALPVGSSGLGGGQLTVTLPAPVAVTAGVQIALQVSAPSLPAGSVHIAAIEDGVNYFPRPGGWGGTADYAQYNGGQGWAAWPGQSTYSDLSAYCDLAP
jgi:hypothetical protein